MDTIRYQLKTLNRQQGLYSKAKTMMKNNLIALLDQTYPGINALFDSPVSGQEGQRGGDLRRTQDVIAMLPPNELTKLMIAQAIDALNAVSKTLERLKAEMRTLASQLPEYPVVMEMHGVGDCLGPQLMAEIGDVTRFAHRGSFTTFPLLHTWEDRISSGASRPQTAEAAEIRTGTVLPISSVRKRLSVRGSFSDKQFKCLLDESFLDKIVRSAFCS